MIEIDADVALPERKTRLTTRERVKALYIEGVAPVVIAQRLRLRLSTVRPYCNYDA